VVSKSRVVPVALISPLGCAFIGQSTDERIQLGLQHGNQSHTQLCLEQRRKVILTGFISCGILFVGSHGILLCVVWRLLKDIRLQLFTQDSVYYPTDLWYRCTCSAEQEAVPNNASTVTMYRYAAGIYGGVV